MESEECIPERYVSMSWDIKENRNVFYGTMNNEPRMAYKFPTLARVMNSQQPGPEKKGDDAPNITACLLIKNE